MRDPVSQITLRVPAMARDHLRDVCVRYGVTKRGIFEAIVTMALTDETHPVWRPQMLKLWAAAKRVEESGAFQAEPRRKIIVHMTPELAGRFKEACQRHGVSQNAALGLMLMPVPEKQTPEFRVYLDDVLPRVMEFARRADYTRRHRKPERWPPPPEHPPTLWWPLVPVVAQRSAACAIVTV